MKTFDAAWNKYNEAVQVPCAKKRAESHKKEVECAFAGGAHYAIKMLGDTLIDEGPEAMCEKMLALRKEIIDRYAHDEKNNPDNKQGERDN